MFCFIIKKRLVPYMEGALSPKAAAAVDKHVSRCPKCAAELALIRGMCSTLRAAKTPVMEPATDLWQRIEQQIAVTPAPVRQKPLVRGLQYACAGVAVAVAVMAVRNIPTKAPDRDVKVMAEKKQPRTVVAQVVASKPEGTYSGDTISTYRDIRPVRKPKPEVFMDNTPATPPVEPRPDDIVIVSSAIDKPVGTWESRYSDNGGDRVHFDYWRGNDRDAKAAENYSMTATEKPSDILCVTAYTTDVDKVKTSGRVDTIDDTRSYAVDGNCGSDTPGAVAAPKVVRSGDLYFAAADLPKLADRKVTTEEDRAKDIRYKATSRDLPKLAWSTNSATAVTIPDEVAVLAEASPVLGCMFDADISPADDHTSVDIINDADDSTRLVALFSY